jgi:cytoskeletal protein CcmA (bactofilin family)
MLRALILTCCLMAAPAFAEDAVLTIAQDRYQAGASVRFDGPAVTDLFMAGNRVVVAAPVAGSAHLAGRRVTVEATVAGDLFAAGYSVVVDTAVTGDASITGYEVTVGSVGGNLRAAGAEVTLANVGGYALVSSANVILNGAVSGDMVLVADRIEFGPDAKVAGALTIYAQDPSKVVVPESVVPAARVKIEARDSYDSGEWRDRMPIRMPFWRIVQGFLSGVVISGLIAALVIAIAPKAVQSWRELALAHPGRAIWSGFLVTSALAGSGFVLMLTIIGVILLPVMLIVTCVAIFAGYALGSYVLGAGLWLGVGRPMPEGLLGKFGLACLGAFIAGLAWLVPVAGWFFVLALTLMGIGTLAAFVLPRGLLLHPDPAAV